jgi:hypothetical protein
MAPLIRQDDPAARDIRVTADRTLIRRYVLALIRNGTANEAAVTATSVPPLSGGPDIHCSAAIHELDHNTSQHCQPDPASVHGHVNSRSIAGVSRIK